MHYLLDALTRRSLRLFNKTHPPSHYIKIRNNFAINTLAISNMRGCINSTNSVRASVSVLTKLCATFFSHNARTSNMLLNLIAKLDNEVV